VKRRGGPGERTDLRGLRDGTCVAPLPAHGRVPEAAVVGDIVIRVVRQGECLASLAARYGLHSWRDLYGLPANAALKALQRHPNILAPGDEVTVPDPAPRWETRPKEKRHRFIVPTGTVKLRIFVRDRGGHGFGDKRYVVEVEGRATAGRSTAEGLVEVEVPATAESGRLQMWLEEDDDPTPHVDRELRIGHLDPVETITGVQGRLRNLGYDCDPTGELDSRTLASVGAFRASHQLPEVTLGDDPNEDDVAGLLDDALRTTLRAAHEGA
jgi:hypothetical protein